MVGKEHQRRVIELEAADTAPAIQSALDLLADARAYAREMDADIWQFAVEFDDLIALGLARSDLRWLALMGYVEHAREITAGDDATRRFQPGHSLAFPNGTCFVLTDAGLFACSKTEGAAYPILGICSDDAADSTVEDLMPRWDRERRTLYVGDQIVKQYREPSPNQEAVITAFHQEGWAHRIDDPLPPSSDQDPKFRLHHTIQRLNNHQHHPLIRFRGDDTGQGVFWELTENVSVTHSSSVDPKNRRIAA
jgi:hypothetical protein